MECSKLIKELSTFNAVVVVEHRKEIFSFADKVFVFGPLSGPNGGIIINILSGSEYLKSLPSIDYTREKNNSRKKFKQNMKSLKA